MKSFKEFVDGLNESKDEEVDESKDEEPTTIKTSRLLEIR